MSKKLLRLLCLLMALSLVAAACGDDDDDTSAGGGTTETTEAGGGAAKELKPVPGFDGTTIKLGVLTPLTDRVAVIGKPLTAGNKAWFDSINAKGGIAGKYKVELDIQDTKYDPPTTVQLYNQLKNNVVMFAQILGSQPIKAVLPQLKTDKIVAQPATLDAEWIGEQNLLPIGGPYQIQSMNAVYYWVNDGGGKGKTLCAMSQDDEYGEAGMEGVDFAAEKLGIKVAANPKFKVSDQDFTAQINQLKSAKCDAVFLVATAGNLSGIMTAAVQNGLQTQWIGQSPAWLGLFANTGLKDYLQQHFWLISDGPTWDMTDAPGVKELVEIHDTYAKDVQPGDQYFGFGVSAARAVSQVLEKAVEMGDLSREGIIKAMNSLDELDFGGITPAYKWGPPEDRDPPRTATMYKIDATKPNGLSVVKAGIEAPWAKDFEFGKP
jgi:ABC-type branched-subunit amino acid transport system substrate-binding protein